MRITNLGVCVLVALGAFSTGCVTQPARGLLVRLYDIGVDVASVPELAPDQTPNVIKIVPTLDLQSDRKDFAPLENRFLTEVVGRLTIEQAGTYRFRLLSDDGGKLWLDGKLLIDHDGLHGPTPKDSEPIELAAGPHELHVWHLQAGGGAQLTLQWASQSHSEREAQASVTPVAREAPASVTPAAREAPASAAFEFIPAALLSHAGDASTRTSLGQKKIIPPLRRGRPGDGTMVLKPHPAIEAGEPAGDMNTAWEIKDNHWVVSQGHTTEVSVAWIPDDDGASRHYAIDEVGIDWHAQFPCLLACPDLGGEIKRLSLDNPANVICGCALRVGAASERPPARLRFASLPFEIFAVRAMSNGFEIDFTKPLDSRCGWDPESYYIEQWPFRRSEPEAQARGPSEREAQASAGARPSPDPSLGGRGVAQANAQGPHRDGIIYAVKSASVSPDRKKVFLEIPDLKTSHVVYIRLLPPCVSEDGELPWSTEAWYTLNAIPTDRTGTVLTPPAKEPQNFLTDEEKQAGWRLLFDGQTPDGWHTYNKETPPAGWQVQDGCLVRMGPGGDIITDEEFQDFELSIEWRISPGGNSGIMYRVTEDHGAPWETGPEYQILDNAEHADGRDPLTSAASCYALYAPPRDVAVPVGFFNKGRIVVQGDHVEHWLNGVKVVEYELHSPEWNKLYQGSKFHTMPDYGSRPKGGIDLQDHGDKVWYRNIKIRIKN